MLLERAVEVVTLAKAANQNDARDGLALGAQVVDLPLDEVADLFDDGVEDVFDLGRGHHEETTVETDFFVIGETGESVGQSCQYRTPHSRAYSVGETYGTLIS